MRYLVKGSDRNTAQDMEIIVEASTTSEAEEAAHRRGILIGSVTPADAPRRFQWATLNPLVVGLAAVAAVLVIALTVALTLLVSGSSSETSVEGGSPTTPEARSASTTSETSESRRPRSMMSAQQQQRQQRQPSILEQQAQQYAPLGGSQPAQGQCNWCNRAYTGGFMWGFCSQRCYNEAGRAGRLPTGSPAEMHYRRTERR